MIHYRMIDSPIGPLTLAGHGGALTHVLMADQAHSPSQQGWTGDAEAFAAVVHQLDEYFAGKLFEFDIELDLHGTDFQQRVWKTLLTIPYGQTRTYGEIAEQIGTPSAARAVGLANGRNPISIIVPCHRVIGANGQLVGYGGGLQRKHALLELEQSRAIPRLY